MLSLSRMPTLALLVPILPVRDLARAMDFYRRLGFTTYVFNPGIATPTVILEASYEF